jgi:hypothetical protein
LGIISQIAITTLKFVGVEMKYGAAVVLGALGMFISGYVLGYSTAVPDVLRAANLNPDGTMKLEDMNFDVSGLIPVSELEPTSTESSPPSEADLEAIRLQEIQELKKMIVPLLTDDEIKKIREEALNTTPAEASPTESLPVENSAPELAPSAP